MTKKKLLAVFLFSLVFLALCRQENRDYDRACLLVVGEDRFKIRRGYVWAWDAISDGQIYGPNLHALYPGFEPKSKSNAKEFDKPGWADGRLISFLLKESWKYIPNRATVDRIKREGKKGKRLYRLDRYSSFSKDWEYLVGETADKKPVYFFCHKDGKAPSPSCSTHIEFSKHTVVYLVFPRTLLKEWETLCSALLQKIDSFKVIEQ